MSKIQDVLCLMWFACFSAWTLSLGFVISSATAACDTRVSALVIAVSPGTSESECKLDINYEWRSRNWTSWLFDNCPYKFEKPYYRNVCFKEKAPLEIHTGDSAVVSVKSWQISTGLMISFAALLIIITGLGFWSGSDFKLPQLSWPKFRYLKWSGETELQHV